MTIKRAYDLTPPPPRFWPGSVVGNPPALIQWAVASGRLAAADSAQALINLTGPGAVAYADLLIGADAGQYLKIGG